MKGRVLLVTIGALWAVSLSVVPAHADEGWVITSFHSDIRVAPDSTLTITEDIRVDFGSQQHHGIFRSIPYEYRYDSSHDRLYSVNFVSVTDGSKAVPYSNSGDGAGDYVLKIGNPNVLVSGAQRYVITYTVYGAMNSFPDHDEVYWNVDGAQWPVPKRTVTANVTFPPGAYQKATCYEGPAGSTEACRFQTAGNNSVAYTSARQLGSGEQLTVVTALNKGVITVPPPNLVRPSIPSPAPDPFLINPATVAASALILIAGVGLIVWFWLQHGRDREYLTQYYLTNDPRDEAAPVFQHQPVVVEFEPPQNLRPAELGLILDENADTKDVTATIVDLAVRGVLTIAEVPGQKDWVLTWKPNTVTDILPFERTLLDRIFASGQQVHLSELKGTFKPALQSVENQMYQDAMSRKFFTTRPDYLRGGRIALGLLLIFAAFFLFKPFASVGWGLVSISVGLVGVILILTYKMMSVRTAAGRDLMQHTLGFRLYMNTAEKYRQQFAEKAEIFTQLLPYAIVFGCVTRWAKAFDGLNLDPSKTNGWYVGGAGQTFQAAAMAATLQSMYSTISNSISYSPAASGSSGFGGGGFSGGGGGGGGGGAW